VKAQITNQDAGVLCESKAGGADGARGVLAALFSHTLATREYNYHGQVLSADLIGKVDVAWRTYLGLRGLDSRSVEPIFDHPVSLVPPNTNLAELWDDLGRRLYRDGSLRHSQIAALSPFLQGKSVGVFSPVASGKSCVFLAAAVLSGRRSQFVLVMSPMRSVGLNAQSSCLAAGVPALVFNAESADLVLESLRAFDGVGVSTLPFSCLILAYEGLVFDSAASTALGLAVQKNRISRIVYDEG
jgi:hypothetical protein